MATATLTARSNVRAVEPWMVAADGNDYARQHRAPTTEKSLEETENEYLFALAEKRLKNDSGKTYSFEDILARDGLTLADLDNMEDVEIE